MFIDTTSFSKKPNNFILENLFSYATINIEFLTLLTLVKMDPNTIFNLADFQPF